MERTRAELYVETFQELGLNLYESKAYLALITHGDLTPKELYQHTDIPQSRTYDVLESLSRKGFATKLRKSNAYRPTNPKIALPGKLQALKWELESSRHKKDEELRKELELLQSHQEELLRMRQEKVDSILEPLDDLYEREVKTISQSFQMVEGQMNCVGVLSEILGGATKEIFCISTSPRLPVPQIWTVVRQQLERGVRYYRISDYENIVEWGAFRIRSDVSESGVQLRLLPNTDENFYMVDDRILFVRLLDAATREVGYTGFVLELEPFLSIFKARFKALWEDATDAVDILHVFESNLTALKGALAPQEAMVAHALFERGKYTALADVSKIGKLSLAEVNHALEVLQRRELIMRVSSIEYLEGSLGYMLNYAPLIGDSQTLRSA